jgi:hypothetical protein
VQARRDMMAAHTLYLCALRATGASLLHFIIAKADNPHLHSFMAHHHQPPSPPCGQAELQGGTCGWSSGRRCAQAGGAPGGGTCRRAELFLFGPLLWRDGDGGNDRIDERNGSLRVPWFFSSDLLPNLKRIFSFVESFHSGLFQQNTLKVERSGSVPPYS